MNFNETVLDADKHGRDMARIPRLITSDRAKFNRKEINAMARDNLLLGRLNLAESILKSHIANPYTSVDELIGDIQIMLVDSNNALRIGNPQHPLKFSVEDLITKLVQ